MADNQPGSYWYEEFRRWVKTPKSPTCTDNLNRMWTYQEQGHFFHKIIDFVDWMQKAASHVPNLEKQIEECEGIISDLRNDSKAYNLGQLDMIRRVCSLISKYLGGEYDTIEDNKWVRIQMAKDVQQLVNDLDAIQKEMITLTGSKPIGQTKGEIDVRD